MDNFGRYFGQAYQVYQQVKERNTGQVVNPNGCGRITNMFTKDGHLDGPGGHTGPCGVKKDHRRVYCCQGCYARCY
jgi:hypothetical protein